MHLTVELFGIARTLAEAKQVELELAPGCTLRDVVAALAVAQPKLVGPIVAPGGTDLVAPYLCNLDGRHTVQDLEYQPHDGQHILLLFGIAGG